MVNGVNSGNVILPVTHTGTVTDYNNLVGNPYPSQIDWDLVTINGSVSSTIAIRDNGTGNFRYHTRGAAPVDLPNGVIAMGQAFWVRTTAAAPVVTVTEASKSATTGNIFFRERKGTDLLAIELTGSTQVHPDNTYVILRDGSSQDFDDFDAPKMNNYVDNPFTELVDLHTKTTSGKNLALNFLPSIPCGYTLPVVVKDIKTGSYTFNFEQIGILASYDITLTDNFLGTSVNVTNSHSYAFTATSDAASKAAGRFVLTFTSQPVNLAIESDDNVSICDANNAKINIYDSQPGVEYYMTKNGIVVSDSITGNGHDIELTIPVQNLAAGANQLMIKATAGCDNTVTLTQQVLVESLASFTPSVTVPLPQCQEGQFVLQASGAPNGATVKWYDSESSSAALFSGPQYTTPLLTESKTYYVSILSSVGCEGSRVAVEAHVTQFEDASILVEGDTLFSNYESGNQWYRNDEIISGATQSKLIPDVSGVYTVRVAIENCVSTSEGVELVIEGSIVTGEEYEGQNVSGVTIFPNPVTDELTVELPISPNQEAYLMNSVGQRIGKVNLKEEDSVMRGKFDMRGFASGLYIFRIQNASKVTSFKIYKK